MKHGHVQDTLLFAASDSPPSSLPLAAGLFATPEPDSDPLPRPTRALIVWQGEEWAEIDPETCAILCRGEAGDFNA